MNYRIALICWLLALSIQEGLAQASSKSLQHRAVSNKRSAPLPAYQPTRSEMLKRYRDAAVMDSVVRNAIFKTTIQPNWQPDGEAFWYRNTLKDTVLEYIYADISKQIRRKAFDHKRLADALSKAAGKPFDPSRLRISNMTIENPDSEVIFQIEGKWWKCDLNKYECLPASPPLQFAAIDNRDANRSGRSNNPNDLGPVRRRARAFRSDSLSPDGQWISYVKEGNVFVKSAQGETEVQLSTDGSIQNPYGNLRWSPDNRKLVGYLTRPVKEKQVHYVLTSASGTRGELRSRGYAQPGDENTSYKMVLFDINTKVKSDVQTDVIDFSGPPFLNWRSDDSRYFTFEKVDRGHQRFRIIEVDVESGKTRELVDEKTQTFIYEQKIFTHYLPATNEILWVTEKDGWRHIYLLDERTGAEKKQITQGKWVVREIDSIDQEGREIWFQASGMNPSEDPYHIHYYRIRFDGTGLIKLTEADGNHRALFSPNRKYFIDQFSKVNTAPLMELRRTTDGTKLMDLERADISGYLATGIKLPEVFTAKGRDGVSDIWGIMFRPSNFNPNKRYPVIEQIYAGPQGSFVPKNFTGHGEPQSLAELGFIVVQIDGMGTYNRSKAFHDVCWKNLADAGFPDRILWMKALAAKYPYVDTNRVGIYGTSAGGQNAAGAVLFHPDFYKVAVSSCGCHDNRVDKQWWNEQWMGYPVAKHYGEQSNITNAYKLQGEILLIVGEADENVPPESTYRVADALIKAGKTFDFLAIPGMGHSDGGAYGRKKKRDFFVKHLLGVDSPKRNAGEL